MTDPRAFYESPQEWLNKAVLYALRSGCFFPVPEPDHATATTEDWVKWGAMRNLHDAIAAFTAPEPPDAD